jgi:hypothetical protein
MYLYKILINGDYTIAYFLKKKKKCECSINTIENMLFLTVCKYTGTYYILPLNSEVHSHKFTYWYHGK